MLSAQKFLRAQVISVIAATVIALACGTNYVYSAWAPQFAKRLKLSSTQSNLIGTFGNVGNYATGIPWGILIDAKGPRWGVALSIALFAVGYYPLARAFDAGPGAFSFASLCLFSFFTGAGSSSASSAALKAAALNFPEARGTATGFPLAAYGLSASAFATVALALPHDTSHFLLLLATGTVVLPLISFAFLRTPPQQAYKSLPQYDISTLRPIRSSTRHRGHTVSDLTEQQAHSQEAASYSGERSTSKNRDDDDNDDAASLFSTTSSEAMADLELTKALVADQRAKSQGAEIRGLALLRHVEFWQLFAMLGILAGVGLMTINNIGNDTLALWKKFDPTTTEAFIAKRQVAHVSTLSVCSFTGRLLSGIGSDVLVNKYNQSRLWCLFASASLFAVAQLVATFVELPDLLILVAGVTGIAYGMLWGVYPTLIAHAFGVEGMSQNWGFIILAPMLGGNVFNILYGKIYDSHSIIDEKGDRECLEGRACYSKAYLASWAASLFGLLICGWSLYHEKQTSMKRAAHHRAA